MDKFWMFMPKAGAAVGVTVGVAVRLIQLGVGRLRGQPFSRTVGWPATSAWTLGFAIATVAAASILSIGPFYVLPVAVIVCGIAAWRCRALPEGAIGAGLGTGFVLFVIGLMNSQCGALSLPFGIGAHHHSYSGCGGANGTLWLPLAVALVVAAVAGQILMERRKTRRTHSLGAASAM